MGDSGGSSAVALMLGCSCICSVISLGACAYSAYRWGQFADNVAKNLATIGPIGGVSTFCDTRTGLCEATITVVEDKKARTYRYVGLSNAETQEIRDRTVQPGPTGDMTFISSGRTVTPVQTTIKPTGTPKTTSSPKPTGSPIPTSSPRP